MTSIARNLITKCGPALNMKGPHNCVCLGVYAGGGRRETAGSKHDSLADVLCMPAISANHLPLVPSP